MIEIILIIILWLFITAQLTNAISFFSDELKKPKIKKYNTDLPNVCILIAARNEEQNLQRCIESLLMLNYPKEKLEILFGNDNSSDSTENILISYSSKHQHIKYINIYERIGNAKAKANVLSQLIKKTNAPYIFVTDADITVNPDWINELLPYLQKNFDIVSGTTILQGNTWWPRMQMIEWLLANAQIIGFDRGGIKTTAVGNNMAFTRDAYLKTGGYENMEYSVTEDFQLYKYILSNKGKTLNLLNAGCLNLTSSPNNFITYLHQRKRWMKGAEGLSFAFKILLTLYAAFFPLVIILLFINWYLALLNWIVKFLVQSVIITVAAKRVKQTIRFYDLFLFEIYTNINTLIMVIFYITPVKMKWKNREG
ncbi:MAG: glycosyltransferase [Bacteroidia bacterium]